MQARLAASLPTLAARFGRNVNVSLPNLLALLLSLLPKLPAVAHQPATSADQASLQMQAMASLNWQVPSMVASVQIGLPTCAFVASLQAALNISAVLPSPCGLGCDAASLRARWRRRIAWAVVAWAVVAWAWRRGLAGAVEALVGTDEGRRCLRFGRRNRGPAWPRHSWAWAGNRGSGHAPWTLAAGVAGELASS